MATEKDINFMNLALKLAKKAEGLTSPNPLVGAVLVKNGKIIGRGYHKRSGLPHAEIVAFNDARKKGHKIPGSTLYVSLEPCCHKDKKTPPCTEAIIDNKITKVYVAVLDPNPKVRGKGVRRLRNAKIEVETGILKAEAARVNDVFFKYIKEKMPYTVLKLASTLDGKIATRTGDSKWIGSQKQREIAHKLRNKYDSIMVGINTVLKDDPSLNVRLRSGNINHPLPVILDSNLKTPVDSKIFKVHDKVVIATSNRRKTKKNSIH